MHYAEAEVSVMLSESSNYFIVQSESFTMKKKLPLTLHIASDHTADKRWVITIPFTWLTDQGVTMFTAIPRFVGQGPINAGGKTAAARVETCLDFVHNHSSGVPQAISGGPP